MLKLVPIRPLPVHAHEAELVDAVRRHPVVVVEGPTGCGKTTQIPQMLLRAGITPLRIGVTQPRRIAAVSVAWRIAEEREAVLGGEVGYSIRFDDRTGDDTRMRPECEGIGYGTYCAEKPSYQKTIRLP